MAYVGQGIKGGTFSVLDTSGNTYNGSNTTFNLGTQVGSPAQLLVSHDGVIQKPVTDYTIATGGTQITFTTAPASGASIFITEISGAVGAPMNRDINGDELILDADADTSITADTDDQIDIRIAGADDFQFTANTFTAQSGSTITTPTLGVITAKDLGIGVHIREADSSASAADNADALVIENSASVGMSILSGTSNSGNIFFGDSGDNDVGFITYEHNNERMLFGAGGNHTLQVGGSEVVVNNDSDDVDFRVESDGNTHALFVDGGSDVVRMGTSSGSAKLNIETSAAIVGCLVTCTSASYDANIINLVASRDTTNETYNILRGQNGAGFAIAIRDSGNVENVNNSYGSSSDERIKQNIVDANSQWDDIKALKIRNYKLKKEVAKGVDKTYLGVVAQEVETAGMNGLIGGSTAEDKETVALSSDFGTLYEDGDSIPEGKAIGDIKTVDQKVKSVKYSILYMKAIKALQEAQTRIETLETKVKALEDA
jgi:hypothetical protein